MKLSRRCHSRLFIDNLLGSGKDQDGFELVNIDDNIGNLICSLTLREQKSFFIRNLFIQFFNYMMCKYIKSNQFILIVEYVEYITFKV